MLTAIVFAVAFLLPLVAALGLVLRRRYIVRDEAAGAVLTSVALGLVGGVLMGGVVTGILVGVALLIAHVRR